MPPSLRDDGDRGCVRTPYPERGSCPQSPKGAGSVQPPPPRPPRSPPLPRGARPPARRRPEPQTGPRRPPPRPPGRPTTRPRTCSPRRAPRPSPVTMPCGPGYGRDPAPGLEPRGRSQHQPRLRSWDSCGRGLAAGGACSGRGLGWPSWPVAPPSGGGRDCEALGRFPSSRNPRCSRRCNEPLRRRKEPALPVGGRPRGGRWEGRQP